MTKNFLLQLIMILILASTTSCSKDEIASQPSDGNTTPVSIKLNLAKLETDSRASYQAPALNDVRVTMIVALDGKMLYYKTEEYETISNGSTISFSTNLVTGKDYTIALWADLKDGDSYHYNLNFGDTQSPYVSIDTANGITGSSNKYDAYWGMTKAKIEKNQTIEVTLKRPLAIVNINATDWSTVTSNQPTTYSTTVNAYTSMNLLTGLVNETKEYITINGSIGDVTDGNLSYDYFFAKDQTENLESFTVEYSSNDNSNSYSYTFSNIPIKRNTMTNVSGKIFSGNQTNQQ